MALSRTDKEKLAAKYEAEVGGVEHAFLVSLQGLTVNQTSELRRRLREQGGRCVVVKNRILLHKVHGHALEQLKGQFVGPTAVAFGKDPVGLAKVLVAFAKEAPVLTVKGGIVEGRPVGATDVSAISELPGREQLVAKLVFLLQSPMVRFVRVLAAAGPQRLAQVLDLVGKKKQA